MRHCSASLGHSTRSRQDRSGTSSSHYFNTNIALSVASTFAFFSNIVADRWRIDKRRWRQFSYTELLSWIDAVRIEYLTASRMMVAAASFAVRRPTDEMTGAARRRTVERGWERCDIGEEIWSLLGCDDECFCGIHSFVAYSPVFWYKSEGVDVKMFLFSYLILQSEGGLYISSNQPCRFSIIYCEVSVQDRLPLYRRSMYSQQLLAVLAVLLEYYLISMSRFKVP